LKRWIIPVSLFLLALAVRLPGLGGFVTFDESRWLNRSRWFLTGLLFPAQECPPVEWGRDVATHGLGCTLQIGYPGVTTMWAGSLSLLIHYWQRAYSTGVDLLSFLTTLPIFKLDPAVIVPMRLPLAIVGALFVPLFYLLLRRLFSERVALLVALIVALHPFQIALSRVLHHDALTATFMSLSLLSLLGYWLRGWRWQWLVISAVSGGLALLSKQVSWFLPPFVAVLAGLTFLYRWQVANKWATLRRLIVEGMLWGAIAAFTFVALFPAMWIDPVGVIRVIFSASTGLADEGHTQFFWGEISKDPGAFFYPVGWLLRSTPLEVVGLVGCAIAGGWQLLRWRALKKWISARPAELALALFVGLLWLFVSVSPKKLVRYYLPAFPIIDIFVAFGLLWLSDKVMTVWRGDVQIKVNRFAVIALGGIILVVQGWLVASSYPYYLTYYNPLFGGASGAAKRMTIIGWGEGLNEAAAFLNRQPQAESLQVVTERFCSMVRPFFVGQVACLNSSVGGMLRADYLVYYYNVVQRNLQLPEQWNYLTRHYQPAYRMRVQGLDYVSVYRNPVQHPVDQKSNSLSGVLTTFGYNLSPQGQLTVIWQNLGMEERHLLVGVAATAGVYPAEGGPAAGTRRWITCSPAPDFVAERDTSKAIIESYCPLAEAGLSPGLYDVQLAVGDSIEIKPIELSRLAVVWVDNESQFENVELGKGEKAR
jgi:4-amino-4-deoxy-L-arabinose transferase-like glycosyltransferase